MRVFYQDLTRKVPIEHVYDASFTTIPISCAKCSLYHRRVKRVLDLALLLACVMLSFPIALFAAITIKLESRGPLFFWQERVGRDGRPFWLVKFRSMQDDAERSTGAVWAQPDDPRVTKVGWIIRLLRIDEIPQLYNVLKGEMSLVGPRPERPEFVKGAQREDPLLFPPACGETRA